MADTQLIEGRRVQVVERKPPLPQRLDTLIDGMGPVWYRADIAPQGARPSCEQRRHRFATLREGRYACPDGIIRDLRVEVCADCAAACVRDISVDRLGDAPVARSGPNRKSEVIGWYSGSRPRGRVHL